MQEVISSECPEPSIASPGAGNRLARNIGLLTASQLITWTLTAVWTLLVPRLLGPSGMGLLVMAWAATGILGPVGSLGLYTLLVKEIAADRRRAPHLLGTAVIVRAACVLPCLLIAAAYIRLGHFEGQQAVVLYLAAGVAALFLFLDLLQAAFQAIERMEYLAYSGVLNKSVFTLGGIALVLAGFGATALVVLMVVATALVLVLNALWSRRYFQIDWRVSAGQAWSLFLASFPYWGSVAFLSIYQWIDAAMLAVMTPATVVGWYGVPTRLLGTLVVVPTILYTAWLPRLVAANTIGPEHFKRVAQTPIQIVTILGLPIGVGAALIAGPFIMLLYGRAFAPSVPVFVVLALSAIPNYLDISISQLLISSNRQATWMRALGVASIVNPVLNFFLIQWFQSRYHNGALGAAISFLLTELLLVAIGMVMVRHLLYPQTLTRLGRAALATLAMAALASAASRLGVIAEVLTGVIAFGLFTVVLRVVTPEQARQALRRIGWAVRRVLARRMWAPSIVPPEQRGLM